MATPNFDALVAKVRDWSNKPDSNTISTSVIEDCLAYSADEAYRLLRIPPLEEVALYTVESTDNTGLPNDVTSYTSFAIPEDLTQFIYVRVIGNNYTDSAVFDEISDKRTFFNQYAETYTLNNWMWQDGKIFLKPQLSVGTQVEIHYYKRLPALNATYSVIPVNYIIAFSDADQPYLEVSATGTTLYFSTSGGVKKCFATYAEAELYNSTVTSEKYIGKEVSNWLRDENERLIIWGALYNLGAYLFDDVMEKRYQTKFLNNIESLNKEEKWRRSLGGNVQINVNGNGLI